MSDTTTTASAKPRFYRHGIIENDVFQSTVMDRDLGTWVLKSASIADADGIVALLNSLVKPTPDTTELASLVLAVQEAADGDSNDDEIQALQEALSEACSILGVEYQ